MKLLVALLGFVCCLPIAQADIWLCVADNGRQSIQDKPCGQGMRQKSHMPDASRSRSAAAPTVASSRPSSVNREAGLQRNKGVICKLLNTERSDALMQISGAAQPPPGEDPKDNLAKIEKQRTRVGCDAS